MTVPARIVLAGLSTLALITGGCGGFNGPSDEEMVKDTVDSFYRAFSLGDGEEACAYLTPVAQGELVQNSAKIGWVYPDCEATVDSYKGNAIDSDLVATADEVVVSGDEANATLGFTGNVIPLEKVDDRWLISRSPA